MPASSRLKTAPTEKGQFIDGVNYLELLYIDQIIHLKRTVCMNNIRRKFQVNAIFIESPHFEESGINDVVLVKASVF
jgi:hypothetical protein